MTLCSACNSEIEGGEPWVKYKNILLCSSCYINLVPEIFRMKGAGDGGVIEIMFNECVKLKYNLKRKKSPIPTNQLYKRMIKSFNPEFKNEELIKKMGKEWGKKICQT